MHYFGKAYTLPLQQALSVLAAFPSQARPVKRKPIGLAVTIASIKLRGVLTSLLVKTISSSTLARPIYLIKVQGRLASQSNLVIRADMVMTNQWLVGWEKLLSKGWGILLVLVLTDTDSAESPPVAQGHLRFFHRWTWCKYRKILGRAENSWFLKTSYCKPKSMY